MSTLPPPRPANSVSGWDLRSLLTLALFDAGRPLTVDELVRSVTDRGLVVWGRPSKVVSDAMRAEMHKGRVRRVARGWYVADRISRSTKYRFRQRTARLLARIQPAA